MKFKEFYLQEKLGKTYEKSCVLFDFPKDISTLIQNWAKLNIKEEDLREEGLENETHITIIYGLNEPDPWPTFFLLQNQKPFYIELGKISKFEASDYDVLKIDVHSQELNDLHEYLKNSIDNEQTHPLFLPHVTLAYIAKNTGDKFLGHETFQGMKVLVNAVDFSSSNGQRERMYFK